MGRVLLRDIEPGATLERATATGIEAEQRYWVVSDNPNGIATLSGKAPEIRLVETDQTDPVGRWQLGGTGGGFGIQQTSAAGAWDALGSGYYILLYSDTNNYVAVSGVNRTDKLTLTGGRQANTNEGAQISLLGQGNGACSVTTPNADESGNFSRLEISGKATEALMTINNCKIVYGSAYPTQTTVGAAGGASALPATPTGYIRIRIGSTEKVQPYYDQA